MDELFDPAVAGAVHVQDGRPLRRHPAVPPATEGEDNGLEIAALVGEDVLVVLRMLRVLAALHEPVFDEAVQAGGQHVRRHAEPALKVGEAGDPGEQRVADDQEAPPLADDFQGARGRAVLILVGPTEHGTTVTNALASRNQRTDKTRPRDLNPQRVTPMR